MAKRERDESLTTETILVTNGKIKGYHEFHIKCLEGMELEVRREVGGVDDKGLLCYVPKNLPQEYRDQKVTLKSAKKTYYMREKTGMVVGRVQYFLNEVLVQLLEEGKVLGLTGLVTGQPTRSKAPPASQRWKKNIQEGGGAFIPCTWKIEVKTRFTTDALERIKICLDSVEAAGMVARVVQEQKRPR